MAEAVERYGVDSVIYFPTYKSPDESPPVETAAVLRQQSGAEYEAPREAERRVGPARCLLDMCVGGTPERVPAGEHTAILWESAYGESKAMIETALGWYDQCLGVRCRRAARRADREDWTPRSTWTG
jgi:hypothetical protein